MKTQTCFRSSDPQSFFPMAYICLMPILVDCRQYSIKVGFEPIWVWGRAAPPLYIYMQLDQSCFR